MLCGYFVISMLLVSHLRYFDGYAVASIIEVALRVPTGQYDGLCVAASIGSS